MLDNAANVVQREFGKTGVAVARKHVLTVFPDRLVDVHAGTVVTDDGLGHEGRRLAVRVSDVLYRVLHDLQPVRPLHQRCEAGADFTLARGSHLVVMHFHLHALLFQGQAHGRADVLQRVDRRHGEIATLHRRPVC